MEDRPLGEWSRRLVDRTLPIPVEIPCTPANAGESAQENRRRGYVAARTKADISRHQAGSGRLLCDLGRARQRNGVIRQTAPPLPKRRIRERAVVGAGQRVLPTPCGPAVASAFIVRNPWKAERVSPHPAGRRGGCVRVRQLRPNTIRNLANRTPRCVGYNNIEIRKNGPRLRTEIGCPAS